MAKFTWANWDKKPRCTECHCIPDKFWEGAKQHFWTFAKCDRCDLRWSIGQAKLRLKFYRIFGR